MEYGPTEDSIRKANADVRQCLSDMGTEFAIANFPDVVDEYIDNSAIGNKQNEFLYPFAMQVPGLQHIVDWVFRQGISRLKFFAQWQQKSKAVLQYARASNHRGHVEDIVSCIEINRDSKPCIFIGQSARQVCKAAVEDFGQCRS